MSVSSIFAAEDGHKLFYYDIQIGNDKFIDIAFEILLWITCYTAFGEVRATTKELHRHNTLSAEKMGVFKKSYLPITTFVSLSKEESNEFRIEKKDSFKNYGFVRIREWGMQNWWAVWQLFGGNYDNYNFRLWNGGGRTIITRHLSGRLQPMILSVRVWGRTKVIIGAEYKGKRPDGMMVQMVPTVTWAVFIDFIPTGID